MLSTKSEPNPETTDLDLLAREVRKDHDLLLRVLNLEPYLLFQVVERLLISEGSTLCKVETFYDGIQIEFHDDVTVTAGASQYQTTWSQSTVSVDRNGWTTDWSELQSWQDPASLAGLCELVRTGTVTMPPDPTAERDVDGWAWDWSERGIGQGVPPYLCPEQVAWSFPEGVDRIEDLEEEYEEAEDDDERQEILDQLRGEFSL